jgi:hypothetical protein
MTIDFYIDGSYIGCGSYDSEAGLWESSVDLGDAGDAIEAALNDGDREGKIGNIEFRVRSKP